MSQDEGFMKRKQELMRLYAPRCPMAKLPVRYRVTEENPDPPTLYFAFPHLNRALYKYADKHGLTKYHRCDPPVRSPATMFIATDHLAKHVDCELKLDFPFLITAECTAVIVLYSNYTMKDTRLIEEDEEDVIQMVQEALGYDKSVRPKWYFERDDPWEPGDDEDA